jgi:hypothetical protein
VAVAYADDWDKDYAVTGTPNLRLDTKDGNVELSTWDQNKIHIHVWTEGYRIGPHDLRIDESQSGDNVGLSLHVPDRVCFFYCRSAIKVSVQLPRQANLDVRTGDGEITGSDVHGNIRVRSGDGNVTLDRLDGRLEAESGDGNVRIGGRFDKLDVSTGDGNIEANVDEASKLSESWIIHSGDGNVKLYVPSNLSADVELRTGDGKIHLDVPIQVSGSLNPSYVNGKLNQGGAPLEVHTGDGNIELAKR